MWPYKEITRKEFELVKDKVEKVIVQLGGSVFDITLPYENITNSICAEYEVMWTSKRSVYRYGDEFFRVSEVCFDKPFIVIECGNYDDLIHNRMEDADPFPYDLEDELLEKEVMYSLGILQYPTE